MSADIDMIADARRFRFILATIQRHGDAALHAMIEACVEEKFGADSEVVPTENQIRELIDLIMERDQWQG